jgi:hypothetical protein
MAFANKEKYQSEKLHQTHKACNKHTKNPFKQV